MLQDLTFSLAVMRGECALELDGACCGDQLFEDLKCVGFCLVATELVPSVALQTKQIGFISIKMTSEFHQIA